MEIERVTGNIIGKRERGLTGLPKSSRFGLRPTIILSMKTAVMKNGNDNGLEKNHILYSSLYYISKSLFGA